MVQLSVIRGEITQNTAWHQWIIQADEWVRDALGEWQHGKNIEWTVRTTASGQPVFSLTLRSRGSQVESEFNAREIVDRKEVIWKATQLWGDLNNQNTQDTFQNIHRILSDWRAEEREEVAGGHQN